MSDKDTKDITLDILISIRDEIRQLRADTNERFAQMDKRFAQMDRRFEHIETDIAEMKIDMKTIVTRFDRDYLLLASETEDIKRRLSVCERKLNVYPSA